MLLIRQRRVVHYRFIVKLHQAVHDQPGRVGGQLALLRLDDRCEVLDVDTLGGALTGDLGLEDLTLSLVALVHSDPLGLEVLDYQVRALC